MAIALTILAFIFLLAGLLGSVLPVLPGPPLSFIGLLLLQWGGYGGFSPAFLWVWAGITATVTVMDNILPALLTKKFGGSRAAVVGSIAGLIIGMLFFPPLGILVGPFLGALAGELLNNFFRKSSDNIKALKAALGAFLAFIVGTGAKLMVVSFMIYYAVKAVFA